MISTVFSFCIVHNLMYVALLIKEVNHGTFFKNYALDFEEIRGKNWLLVEKSFDEF